MKKRLTKQELFNLQVEGTLKLHGAEINTFLYPHAYKWQLPTKYGMVIFTVHDDELKCKVFSVYTQFAEWEKYEEQIKKSGISGHWKWNIHTYDAKEALDMLEYRLRIVALEKAEAQ